VAIARGTDKEQVVLSTISSGTANTEVIGGLAPHGELIVVGASPEPVEAAPGALIGGARSVSGHPSGTAMDSQDTLAFSALQDVRPRIETMPLERAGETYAKMMAGDARFRMVLTTGA
jgi:D-arabinose 1-dehydrogenase-like Zn-dependent alcohol dehydrogenase